VHEKSSSITHVFYFPSREDYILVLGAISELWQFCNVASSRSANPVYEFIALALEHNLCNASIYDYRTMN
jgi:hypothetical protein